MTFTFTAEVAWDPNGRQNVKNVSFQVFAVTDTGFTTPLPITDTFGVPLPGNILNSGNQGTFPSFQQATNPVVVLADSTRTYAWTLNCVPSDAAVAAFINTTGSGSALAVKSEVTTGATATALNATYVQLANTAIDVKANYGAKGDGVTDDTTAIQNAINSAFTKPGIVRLPPGVYIVSSLTMKKGVKLMGSGRDQTRIQSKASSGAAALINFDNGYLDNVYIEDIWFQGDASNVGQHCIHAYAHDVATGGSAGWGNGGARRLLVTGFTGHSLWLRGGGTGGSGRELWQHQFLVFEDVELIADKNTAASIAGYITGKNGQETFTNCQFTTTGGTSANAGTNLKIIRETDTTGTTLGDSAPYALTFVNSSIEGRARGVEIERANNIVFYGTYLEVVGNAFKVSVASGGTLISGVNFYNCGSNAGVTGSLVESQDTSTATVLGGVIAGATAPNVCWVGAVEAHNVAGVAITTSANTYQVAVTSNAITLNSYRTSLVNSPATLATINSWHGVGDVIYLKAFGGALSITNTGNINFAAASPVVIPQNQVATLARFDLTGNWHLISTGV